MISFVDKVNKILLNKIQLDKSNYFKLFIKFESNYNCNYFNKTRKDKDSINYFIIMI